MPPLDFAIRKKPGDEGFVDELNSVLAEIASATSKVLRWELQNLNFSGYKTVHHRLGVVPDFVWGFYVSRPSTSPSGLVAIESVRERWTDKTVTFYLPGYEHYIFIVATK